MPNFTQAQVIQNLDALQFKIANDARTRAEFLKDPAWYSPALGSRCHLNVPGPSMALWTNSSR